MAFAASDQALRALADGAREILGRSITEAEQVKLHKYLDLLCKWQRVTRLIGSTDRRWIVEHLILDSLLFLRLLPRQPGDLLDLGSGAGVPGIPVAIVESARITLVEARRRRASFLAAVIRELGLTNVTLRNVRAEVLLPALAGRFNAVVMRCAGDPSELFPVALEFAQPGGVVVASGPPEPRPLAVGEWVAVPGVRPGTVRHFAIARRP